MSVPLGGLYLLCGIIYVIMIRKVRTVLRGEENDGCTTAEGSKGFC